MKYGEIRNLTFIAGNGRHENHRRKKHENKAMPSEHQFVDVWNVLGVSISPRCSLSPQIPDHSLQLCNLLCGGTCPLLPRLETMKEPKLCQITKCRGV